MSRKKTKNVQEITDEMIHIDKPTIVIDKSTVYKKEIEKRIIELKQICLENELPFFCVFGTQLRSDGLFSKATDSLLPEQYYINGESKDNTFSDMVNILNGFTTVYQPEKEMIDADEFGLSPEIFSAFSAEDEIEDID